MHPSRDLYSGKLTWKVNCKSKPTQFANGDARIEVSRLVQGKRAYHKKEQEPRWEKPAKVIRRRFIWGGAFPVTKREPNYLEWASRYVEFPTTGHNSSINNGSGVYKLFRNRERHTVAPTIPGGDIAFSKQSGITHQSVYGQRSRLEASQKSSIPQANQTHGASTPPYQGFSGERISSTQRDNRQREPFRYSDENPSDEDRNRMDREARDRINNLTGQEWDELDEWVNEEALEEWLREKE